MCKIRSVQIRNFRGIRTLDMAGFKRVNILLGNNNSCKSTTLEALMVLMGAAKPVLPVEMNANRNYTGIQSDDLLLFFYGLNADENKILLSADYADGGRRDLQISFFESPVKLANTDAVAKGDMILQSQNYGLLYDYTDNGSTKNHSRLTVRTDRNELMMETSEKTQSPLVAAFVAPRYNFNDFIKHFNQIVTDKEKSLVLDVLRKVEPAIADIAVIGEKVMVDTGLSKLVPVNMLGDGIRKMFTLITAMYSVRGGILLVDEIDNGLYCKTMRTLWSAILQAADILDVQVFASTHSIDSLNSLNGLLTKGMSTAREDVSIHTLRRNGEGVITAFYYEYDKFSHLLANEVEIR